MNTAILSTTCIHRLLGRPALVLFPLVIVCIALLSEAGAVNPPPDGGYPGFNTAKGQNALFHLDVNNGLGNTAIGWFSLFTNVEGDFNTAIGAGTLLANTGDQNTATGAGALLSNTEGSFNTANGAFALFSNTIGSVNTATGYRALQNNATGTYNTATGYLALANNTEGDANTSTGYRALHDNVTGVQNTAVGYYAGHDITGDGNVCIGANVFGAAVDNTTWIRNVNTLTQNFSAGVNDYVTVRLSDGRLGHTAIVSSQRYKEDIKPLAAASQALYALKPVSFRLKKEFDPTQAVGFGLIAEEVEKVDPAMVYHNDKGQAESVRYEMVNAMLLNEFLKEHCKLEQLTKDFESKIAEQQKQIETLAAALQKVNAQFERAATMQVALEKR
jgi:hypothetical protein